MSEQNKFTLELEVDDEFLINCMVTAIEGGIDAWADVVVWRQTQSVELSFAQIVEEEDDDLKEHKIDIDTIRKGIRIFLEKHGRKGQAGQIRGWLESSLKENDAYMVDAIVADCIVQYALFGEVVYA